MLASIKHLPLAVWICSPKFKILAANKAAGDLLGYSLSGFKKMHLYDLCAKSSIEKNKMLQFAEGSHSLKYLQLAHLCLVWF
jgi:PAS domain-containing protein